MTLWQRVRQRLWLTLPLGWMTKPGCKLIGVRQGLIIGFDLNAINNDDTGPFAPLELQVTTHNWHFIDSNVSWHLVVERNARPIPKCKKCGYAHTDDCWTDPCPKCGMIHTGDWSCS